MQTATEKLTYEKKVVCTIFFVIFQLLLIANEKVECLEAKRSFKLAAAESAKETQLKLHQDARNLLAEKTESHRRKNNDLRKILVNLVGEAKVLSKQKKAVEEQQRKVKADIQYLSSVKR